MVSPTTLLIDLDGTLLDNDPWSLTFSFFSRALSALKSHGRVKALRALRSVFQEFETPSKTETNAVRFSRVFAKKLGLSQEKGRALLVDRVAEIFPKLEVHFEPVHGARDFLDWAKGRYRLILATNPVWPQEIIELRLKWAGIDPEVFDGITHWELMYAVKPHAEYYTGILKHWNLKAEECLMIGDRASKDLPASKLGIRVFLLDKDTLKKKKAFAKPLKASRGHAKAWKGNYPGLKGLLA